MSDDAKKSFDAAKERPAPEVHCFDGPWNISEPPKKPEVKTEALPEPVDLSKIPHGYGGPL